jgi:hypothetical protein
MQITKSFWKSRNLFPKRFLAPRRGVPLCTTGRFPTCRTSSQVLKGSLFLLFFLTIGLYSKYHPGIRWFEISDSGGKFSVVFSPGYEKEAWYTLNKAGELYGKLQKLWGMDVKGKIKILLTDVHDLSNGSATFFPFNRIELYLFSPLPDSPLGGSGEWIDLVLSHEMMHIFMMNAGSGFTFFLRKIMGTNPALYPLLYAPVWMQEGLSVVAESQLNDGGRLHTADYKIMLDRLTSAGEIPSLGHIYGEPTDWPGAVGKYFYGAAFFQFLAKQYGEDKVRELVLHYARVPFPLIISGSSTPFELTVSRRFRNIFNKDLTVLWREFIESIPVTPSDSGKVLPLTVSGMGKGYPAVGDKDVVYYVESNYKEYPGIYRLDLRSGKTEALLKRAGINGLFYCPVQKKLYFSAVDYYKTYYTYSDIYALDLSTGNVNRLSKGRRLFHPVSGDTVDGRETLYCIKRDGTSSYLARLDTANGMETVLSPGYSGLAYPALSPDGRQAAVSVKENGENWRIALFTGEGRFIRFITSGGTRSYYPVWKNERELYFITEYNERYRPARIDLETGKTVIYDDAGLPSVRYFSPLSHRDDGNEEAVISFFNARGLDLGRVDMSKLESMDIPGITGTDAGETGPSGEAEQKSLKARKYRFFRDLLPKYFSPFFRSAGEEVQPGVYFSGTDILSKHSYASEGYYGLKSHTFNWAFDYTFDGFYPTLMFRYSDLTDLHRDGGGDEYNYRTRKMKFIGLMPLVSRLKFQVSLYSSIYFERVNSEWGEGQELNLNGVKVGILLNSAKTYYDSISLSDGFRLALSYSRDLEFLGSDHEINTAALEFRHYLAVFRPNVLAVRFALSDSWGKAKRLFFMGGVEPYSGYSLAGDSIFELMRGYPSGYFSGTGGYLLNLEYRAGLFKIEKPFFLSRSLERVYLNVFADIGNMWTEKRVIEPAVSLGAELNLAALIGDFRYVFSVGAAFGMNPSHDAVFYIRIGNSF